MPTKNSKYYQLSPSDLDHIPLKSGIYYFVQRKTEPKTIFLATLIKWQSAHYFLAKSINKLNPDDIFSAGELIIMNNRIIAWCLKSGYYFKTLELNDQKRSGELVKNTGLGANKYFSYSDWFDCEKELFKSHFSEKGAVVPFSYEKLTQSLASPLLNQLHKVIQDEFLKFNDCNTLATNSHDKNNLVYSRDNVESIVATTQFTSPEFSTDNELNMQLESQITSPTSLIKTQTPDDLPINFKQNNHERWANPRGTFFSQVIINPSEKPVTNDITEEAPKRFWCCF